MVPAAKAAATAIRGILMTLLYWVDSTCRAGLVGAGVCGGRWNRLRYPKPAPGHVARLPRCLVPGSPCGTTVVIGARVSSAGGGTPLSPPPAEVLGTSWRSGVVLAVKRVTALAQPAAVASWPVIEVSRSILGERPFAGRRS
jgi:hypothetical protein